MKYMGQNHPKNPQKLQNLVTPCDQTEVLVCFVSGERVGESVDQTTSFIYYYKI